MKHGLKKLINSYAVTVLECNETHRWPNFLRIVGDFLKLMPKKERRYLNFSWSYEFLAALLSCTSGDDSVNKVFNHCNFLLNRMIQNEV